MKPELQIILDECTREMDDIETKIQALQPFDKTRAYLTNYALMKSCGTIEYAYRSIVADYFDQSRLSQVHTYIENTVRKGSMSATYENMQTLLGKFDESWRNDFKSAIQRRRDGQKIIESARSLVNNRHLFAHGQVTTATFNDINHYYKDALILINELDAVVK